MRATATLKKTEPKPPIKARFLGFMAWFLGFFGLFSVNTSCPGCAQFACPVCPMNSAGLAVISGTLAFIAQASKTVFIYIRSLLLKLARLVGAKSL